MRHIIVLPGNLCRPGKSWSCSPIATFPAAIHNKCVCAAEKHSE